MSYEKTGSPLLVVVLVVLVLLGMGFAAGYYVGAVM